MIDTLRLRYELATYTLTRTHAIATAQESLASVGVVVAELKELAQ